MCGCRLSDPRRQGFWHQLEQSGLCHQLHGFFTVEFRSIDSRRIELIQRHQFRVGFSVFAHGVFKRLAVLQDSLAILAGNVFEERLGLFLVFAGSEDAAAGDADKSARDLCA